MERYEAYWHLHELFSHVNEYYHEALNIAMHDIEYVDLMPRAYNTHEVACILAEFTGDNCACNFNGIDEWLPEKCELLDACPNTVGVACWEQYLKHRTPEV